MVVINRRKFISVLFNFLLMVIFILLYQVTDDQNIKLVTVIGIFQYIWMIGSWYHATKNIINVYLIFLILSFGFYMGQPILYLLDIHIIRILTIETAPFTLTQITDTLIFLLTSMALFHFGASFTVKETNKKYEAKKREKSIAFAGGFLFFISVIPEMNFTFISLKTMLTVGYSGIFNNEFLTGTGLSGGIPRFLAGFFKPALMLLILGNINNKKRRSFWLFFSVMYSLLMLISGQRGENSLFLIGLVFLYHYSIKPFSKKQVFNFMWLSVVGLFALSVISNIRNMGSSGYSFSELMGIISNLNFFADMLAEMGYTLLACTTVMANTPSPIPFNGGETYFNSLFSLLPNLFWDVNPAAVGGVDQVFQSFLVQSGGIGSSFIIECYYNFGSYSLVFMPVFGFLLGKLYFYMVRGSANKDYLMVYVTVYLSTFILWYVRSDTVSFWRNFAYYAIFPVLIAVMYNLYARKVNKKSKKNPIYLS